MLTHTRKTAGVPSTTAPLVFSQKLSSDQQIISKHVDSLTEKYFQFLPRHLDQLKRKKI
jgi:hypothetical protein